VERSDTKYHEELPEVSREISWLLQLTPAGWAAYHATVPFASVAFDRLDRALRAVTSTLSVSVFRSCPRTLRSLRPNQ
jgi:hypothetical protein